MNTVYSLAQTLINTVKDLPVCMVNERLIETVEIASQHLDTNTCYSLGLLATISSFHVDTQQTVAQQYQGFIAPGIVADISDEIRHKLRMGEADGIESYAKLMTNPNFNFALKETHLKI